MEITPQRDSGQFDQKSTGSVYATESKFRYVQCHLIDLKRARNQNQLEKCLRSLPRDLDETYERILCSIDEDYATDVQRILTVLCVSKRPLKVQELVDAHAIDLTQPPHLEREGRSYGQEDLIDICRGLVEVVVISENNGEKTSVARIAHFSVQEYLQSERVLQQQAKAFAIQKKRANSEMARICLAYLLEPELAESPLDEKRLSEFPLAHYAALHWYDHFREGSGMESAAEGLILRLFGGRAKSFLTWVRLHDLDRQPKKTVDLNRAVEDIPTPVYYTALLGLQSTLDALIASVADATTVMGTLNARGGYYGNPLQAASARGHEKIVQILLDHGADVNAQGGKYRNALLAASVEGHGKIVHILLNQGADINAQNGYYGSAFQAALVQGHEKIVQVLLQQVANVNTQDGIYANALRAASARGYEKIVQILLDKRADVNAQGGEYGNALLAASVEGHEKIVQFLLEQGADANTQVEWYGNALQVASSKGHEMVVQILLDYGADINAQSGRYGNALQAASAEGYERTVHILLDYGANVNAQGGLYGNALQAASSQGHEELVQILLHQGADINAQGGRYSSALQAASAEGFEMVVQILLDQGADVNAQGGELTMPFKLLLSSPALVGDVVNVVALRSNNKPTEWELHLMLRSFPRMDGEPLPIREVLIEPGKTGELNSRLEETVLLAISKAVLGASRPNVIIGAWMAVSQARGPEVAKEYSTRATSIIRHSYFARSSGNL
ncbi:hypothetical protein AN3267.2 [Aspergillus nidulans FGSC A4]|nr:hypothetical protein AN3267.2 [Aspergillus nidulans FGSC A4]|eukprot:XP_660871.1 hypothetical protein AN3267.2 [Aspergillus nidulans FGSC A4]